MTTGPCTGRVTSAEGIADPARRASGGPWDGVPVVASFRSAPPSDRPFIVAGIGNGTRNPHRVEIALTRREAEKLVADFASFGVKGKP